jgi:2-oxoglutarate/2-oxoacid ferredoxin oxidoreductase subunit alpha
VSYGITSRIAIRAVHLAREQGLKVGALRLITVWPFAETMIERLSAKVKGIVVAEINYGQIVREVERSAAGRCKVVGVGSCGGAVHDPEEILAGIKEACK